MKKIILSLFVFLFINFSIICAQITFQPQNATICQDNDTIFCINVNYSDSTFQWQVNTGSIWDSITVADNVYYVGWDNDTISLINIPESFNSYQYRCLVDTNGTMADTSDTAILAVFPIYNFIESDNICNGDSLLWQGTYYKIAGQYFANYHTANNCDSIYELNLTVNPIYHYIENDTICNGDSLLWQETYYKIAGQYFANYHTANTCDSIYELNLTVNPIYHYIENDTICNGDSLLWQGTYYKITGQYFANYQTANNCDSIYELNLTVNLTYYYTENQEICDEDSLLWQGTYYKITGQYFANYHTVNTCDSIYELNLIVTPLPTPDISGENTVCGNQYDVLYSTSDYISGNIYDWNIEPPNYGEITYQYQNQIFINWGTVSGTITVSLLEKNNYGCEAQASFTVIINESLAPDKAEIELKGNNILICSDTLVDNYQWGYYDDSLNIENILTGEINQFYQAIPFDTINYNYWVITGFNNGCETKSYYKPPTLPTVINEEKIYQEIIIYPNPNKGIFIIEIKNNMFCDVILIIRDNLGREIKKQVFNKNTNFFNKKINIQNVVSGFYFVEIIFNNKQRYVKKIIVK